MKSRHLIIEWIVIMSCFFIVGFKKSPHHHESVASKITISEAKPAAKPLNLNVPLSNINFQEDPEDLPNKENDPENSLIAAKKPETPPLELQGKFIMSQEPEIEKAKSTEGASILINLHH